MLANRVSNLENKQTATTSQAIVMHDLFVNFAVETRHRCVIVLHNIPGGQDNVT